MQIAQKYADICLFGNIFEYFEIYILSIILQMIHSVNSDTNTESR